MVEILLGSPLLGSSEEEHVAPRVNAFRNFLAQVCEQVCAEFEREVLQMSEDGSKVMSSRLSSFTIGS